MEPEARPERSSLSPRWFDWGMFLWIVWLPKPSPGGQREVTHLFPPTLLLNPMYHRELSPSGLSKQSVNRIFTPFVQYSEQCK